MERYVTLALDTIDVTEVVPYGAREDIIQLGAEVLDEQLRPTRRLTCLVRPANGQLDALVAARLKGVTEQEVASAPDVGIALSLLAAWLPAEATLVTWGEHAVRQIEDDLYYKALPLHALFGYLDGSLDCRQLFVERMAGASKRCSLDEALSTVGISHDTDLSHALTDATALARLFAKLQEEHPIIRTAAHTSGAPSDPPRAG